MKMFLVFSIVLICVDFSFADIQLSGTVDDDRLSLVYEPSTGDLSVEGGGKRITVLEIQSRAQMFVRDMNSKAFSGLFDVNSSGKLFKLEPEGFSDLRLGVVLPRNLSPANLAKDLSVDGSYLSGGSIENADLIIAKPRTARPSNDANTGDSANSQPYQIHFADLRLKKNALAKVIAADSLQSLHDVIESLTKNKDLTVIRKFQVSGNVSESISLNVNPHAVHRTSKRTAGSDQSSIAIRIDDADDGNVGAQITVTSTDLLRRGEPRTRRSHFNAYVEMQLNVPTTVFGSTHGPEVRMLVLTLTRP